MSGVEYRQIIHDSAERIFQGELELNKAGFSVCPIHDGDKTPSLKVYADGSYFCFGCRSGGDVIKFIREKYALSFRDALVYLDETYNLKLTVSRDVEDEEETHLKHTEAQIRLLNKAVEFFHKALLDNREALQYALGRGLSLIHLASRRIGYCPVDVTDLQNKLSMLLGSELITIAQLREVGLVTVTQTGNLVPTLAGRLVVPNYDMHGNVVDIIGRRIDNSSEVKYKRLRPTHHLLGGDLLDRKMDDVILCEGVLDREILHQLGYTAVTAGGTHFKDEGAKLLTRAKTIYICFDNEKSGQGERGAIDTALVLIKRGNKDVRICTVPRSDLVDKMDVASFWVDVCDENSVTFHAAFKGVMQTAKLLPDFIIDKVPEETPPSALMGLLEPAFPAIGILDDFTINHYAELIRKKYKLKLQSVVKAIAPFRVVKTIDSRECRIDAEDNCYYFRTYDNQGGQILIRVSNFIIAVKNILISPEGVVRIVRLVNNRGEQSEEFALSGDELGTLAKFRASCLARGNFLFEGDQTHLMEVVRHIFLQKAPFINQPTAIGQVDNIWLFQNCGIDKTGNVVVADKDGIVWLGGKGYTAARIYTSDDDDVNSLPTFNPNYLPITDLDLKEIMDTLKQSLGGYEAYLALGWVVASINSHHLFKHYGNFPYLFLAGKRQSGKSVLGSWLIRFFGMEIEDGKSIRTSTVVGINRRLNYFSSIPSWYDEYRGSDRAIQSKEGFLRGVFNRQSADKGIKANFGLRSERIRGTLILSGEEVPVDNAMRSRCVNLFLSEYKRDPSVYPKMCNLVERFPDVGLHFMRVSQHPHNQDSLIQNITRVTEALSDNGLDNRTAMIYAMAAGSFLTAYGHLLTDEEVDHFLTWVATGVTEKVQELDAEHPVAQFFEDMVSLLASGAVKHGDYYYDGKAFYFPPTMHDVWSEYCKRVGKPCIGRNALLDYIRQEPYYLGSHTKWIRNLRSSPRCYGVDLTDENLLQVQQSLSAAVAKQDDEF